MLANGHDSRTGKPLSPIDPLVGTTENKNSGIREMTVVQLASGDEQDLDSRRRPTDFVAKKTNPDSQGSIILESVVVSTRPQNEMDGLSAGDDAVAAQEQAGDILEQESTASRAEDSDGEGSESEDSSIMTSSLSSFDLPSEIPGRRRSSHASLVKSPQTEADRIASMMANTMITHKIQLGKALLERASCIDSINWLGHHLPECVVAYLIDEIEAEIATKDDDFHSDEYIEFDEAQPSEKSGEKGEKDHTEQGEIGYAPREEVHNDDCSSSSSSLSSKSNDGDDETDSTEDDRKIGSLPQPSTLPAPANSCPTTHSSSKEDYDNSLLIEEPESSRSTEINQRGPTSIARKDSLVEKIDLQVSRSSRGMSSRRRNSMTSQPRYCAQRRGSLSSVTLRNELRKPRPLHKKMPRRFSTSSSLAKDSTGNVSISRMDRRCSNESSYTLNSRSSSNASMSMMQMKKVHVESGSKFTPLHSSRTSLNCEEKDRILQLQALGINPENPTFKPNELNSKLYFDPFPFDSDDEELKMERMRQNRVTKTREFLRQMPGKESEVLNELTSAPADVCDGSDNSSFFADLVPPATRHDCALLFIDISGFTKLSTTLDLEPLSKTINAYFQMIVDEVEAFGGDVLKFAGDAVFAEWQAATSYPLELATLDGYSMASSSCGSIKPWHGLEAEECVLTAAACGVQILNTCADYAVYAGHCGVGPQVATLNVHCAVGFGEVVGVHVGDQETRMEYLILGDPIDQVSEAILAANRGEVVASPEALLILEEGAVFDERLQKANKDIPNVIATKGDCYFQPKRKVHVQQNWTTTLQDFTTKPRERLAKRCDDWEISALKRLRQRMSLYVHPVVVNDDFATKVYPGDRSRAEERHRSEAELRGVYTVFIMPLITARLTGDDEEDGKVLILMNDILLIVTRELARFKGQLRQFIVDDKGVVVIANFGLRGSTFPNMISERALPFSTTVQTLMKTELDTECQVGATFGKAYCGVVGGVSRHEYAVLGPSVNLAARLMANPKNTGFLVDEGVRQKAGNRGFRPLPPVKAKGYADLVPIFEPLIEREKNWKSSRESSFVGREKERAELVNMAEDIIDCGGPSKMVWVMAESGAGKSSLVFKTTRQIEKMCGGRSAPHLISRTICSEGDVFVPFSIARPIFLDVMLHIHGKQGSELSKPAYLRNLVMETDEIRALLYGGARESDVPQALVALVHMCQEVEIPTRYIEFIGRLILSRNPVDALVDDSKSVMNEAELNLIAGFLVRAFLHCTLDFDLVVIALDNMSNMDEMSWKVIQLFWQHGMNIMTIGTSRPVSSGELHINEKFWDYLHKEGIASGRFLEMRLSPMKESDVELLVAESLGQRDSKVDPKLSRDVYVRSGGMPVLASEILQELNKNDLLERSENGVLGWRRDLYANDQAPAKDETIEVGNIGELVLHRMDALPNAVRTHLNLGAILGSSFELMEVVTVFEQYRGVSDEEKGKHAKSVHESLEKAVEEGILEVENKESGAEVHWRYNASDHPYGKDNKVYMFTHDVWRNNILRLTLDEWKRDMHSLIAQSMETVLETKLANDYRVLSKQFGHWKESGSASKAATLALKIGRSLESIGLMHQSLIIYRESLDMWKAFGQNEDPDEMLGGLSISLLEQMKPDDLEQLIRLNVALGRCFVDILDPKESIKAYQTALNIIHRAPCSAEIVDRSIIFPVFSGLFFALRFSLNDDFVYEQGLVRMFLRETRLHGDPIHLCRAFAMQSEMMSRHGKFESALETKAQLSSIYNVKEHSARISQAYGSDRCGQCIAQSALWYTRLGDMQKAAETCESVLTELLPNMDPQNVHNSFLMLYPIIWVMKDNGMALRAKEAFDKYVVNNFETRLDERGFTSDRQIHVPIQMLLVLSGTNCSTEHLEDFITWVLNGKAGRFGSELNFATGSVGRTADSITAEICLLLAKSPNNPELVQTALVRKGYELARASVELTRAKDNSRGMINAFLQVKPVHDELEAFHALLPPERQGRRISCGF